MEQSDGGREEGKMEGGREDGGGNGKMKGRQREERIAFFPTTPKRQKPHSHWLAVSALPVIHCQMPHPLGKHCHPIGNGPSCYWRAPE